MRQDSHFSDTRVGLMNPKYMFFEGPPLVHQFIGRKKELAEFYYLFNRAKIIAIQGPPGIGKSALIGKILQDCFPQEYSLLWVPLYGDEGDIENFYWRYATLKAKQDPGFPLWQVMNKEYLAGKDFDQNNKISLLLQNIRKERKFLLVIDSFEKAAREIRELLEKIIHIQDNDNTVIILSRETPRIGRHVENIQLRGLEKIEARKLISMCVQDPISDEDNNLLYEITEGNPFLLELASRSICKSIEQGRPVQNIIRSIHHIPEIQDYYYTVLKTLTRKEKKCIIDRLALLDKKRHHGRRYYFNYLFWRYLHHNTISLLIKKGALNEEPKGAELSKIGSLFFSLAFDNNLC